MPDLPPPKKVVVLGSTGSIGESSLKVARDLPNRMTLVGLAAHSSVDSLAAQIHEFGIKQSCLYDPIGLDSLKSAVPSDVTLHTGEEGLIELATLPEADLVLIAIVGVAGLRPALAAIEAGKDIAVASKEILVMAGEAVMSAAREKGVKVLPVDSEHNAIFQCLEGHDSKEVSRLILTASGGPFRQRPASSLSAVTVEEALKHPTWEMGRKISIDSATLFNKGLEMIEARWLFDIEMDRVDVIVHPQSIVHSMVEFIDGSILAQLSTTDMCFPIQYAVTWPERVPNTLPPLDFARLARLDFEAPRWEDFPALRLAKEAGESGGTLPAVLNAANEVAVSAFLERHLSFPGIWDTVAETMSRHKTVDRPALEEIIEADRWARKAAKERIP
ncbi:MAG: 1-deoxy-D-xylulose-5-phosphate reductoisomerase [Verrucomicrobiales bacterium]|jgi:1-deoxy-D-xylulose-5-phosphate reductoisomerase|nr:1-deoxy-D-xylulose-5-phosphate reductoisomerase [Verrucomicrobiales bacterium]MBP9224272.1 1-deoxy-D-xylulose-5-phosphate reductoisomerase [Verrucomicrobiales bacterium]HQZ27264.1 1-deoxy-D-xylulose-5-phosphate reductoisomerase [Verrucomicrobiales bacterium]